MKDKILNILMLASVAAALLFTLLNEKAPESLPSFSLTPAETLLPTASPTPIENYRLQRERLRQEEKSALAGLAENSLTDGEIRRMAQKQLAEIIQRNETELAVEAALITRGYPDALCVFQADSLIILFTKPLENADAEWILHLAREISGLEMENIRLSAC